MQHSLTNLLPRGALRVGSKPDGYVWAGFLLGAESYVPERPSSPALGMRTQCLFHCLTSLHKKKQLAPPSCPQQIAAHAHIFVPHHLPSPCARSRQRQHSGPPRHLALALCQAWRPPPKQHAALALADQLCCRCVAYVKIDLIIVLPGGKWL